MSFEDLSVSEQQDEKQTFGKISKLKESWEAESFIIKHNDLTALVFDY